MEPEKSQKSTRKLEEGVRKRLSKEEALQGRSSPAGLPSKPQGGVVVQQSFPSSLKIPREGIPRRVGRPCKAKGPHSERLSKAQTTSPAFMAPRAVPEHSLEGSTWQVVDPIHPSPSSSISALHARITCTTEDPSQKTYVHRPTEVSVKQGEEHHKKEKKPQKPGKYICQYCSRPCAKPSVLQKHIRSHTGERPYPCIPCGFSFKTKSNLYKHRKSHAHRIKAGLASETGGETYPPTLEMEQLGGEEIDDPTEGESTDSEEETSTMASLSELSSRQKHGQSSFIGGQQVLTHELTSLSHPSVSMKPEELTQFGDPSMDPLQKSEDTHTIKQKLALRLSERKKASEEQMFLSPGSKGSTESGYFSRSESAEQQISPPNTNAKSYAEIILGKCGRIGQRSTMTTPALKQGPTEEKQSIGPISVPRTQVIEHITKLITINEAVVDTSEIDSVKPRRSSLSRRSSIESPKAALYRDPFQFDPKCLHEKIKGEHSFLSHKQSHSATETVPLLRSHSMPSSACTISSPHPFRASYSFDDRIVEPEVSSQSHVFSSHPRLLKRQPAIELPLGMDYTSEECGTVIRDTPCKPSDELEVKESELSKKSGKVGRAKGLYECNICGACYKKRGNYETHKKYYCSELHTLKPQVADAQGSVETRKGFTEHEKWPHMLHYKVSPGLEQSTFRKRRIVKSPGDDEESQSFDMPESQATSVAAGSPFTMSDRALNIHRDTGKTSTDYSEPVSVSDIQCRMPVLEGKEKAVLSKEISVIQHTSSFERSESMEQLSSFEEEDKPAAQTSLCSTRPTSHSLQPKLVRQHNIQVPEILVTEEPDKSETNLGPPLKEQGKAEEFQWPQRSQTLSQLPAEKLPPKKKRLRLAEMTQSSGDSSFESMSLTRSPSQESSVSHASSHSVSFEREEGFKAEMQCQTSESPSKSQGHHMLTVPSHHHHAREMRRSASEQTPNVSQTPQISENRSKSFDYGNLTFPASTSSPTAQERRKCFSIRQTSLSKHVAHEPDLMLRDWSETDQPSSSSHTIAKSISYQSSVISHRDLQSDSPQPKQTPKSVHPITEVQEKACLFHQLPVLRHPLILPEQTSELFPTQPMTDILSAQFSLPAVTPPVFHTPPMALQHTLLHPDHFQIPQQLNEQTSFRQLPPYVHLPYPGSSPFPPTFFIPVQPQFSLSTSTEIGGRYSQIKSFIPPSIGVSPHKDFFSEALHCPSHSPLNSEPSSQEITVHSDPVVSLVVPVRLQTHMPSIGRAMYTTLSQILVTHSHCSPSALVIQKFESQSEGSHGSNLAHILPQHQDNLLQTPYLRLPYTKVETSHYRPFTSSSESALGLDLSSSSVGGSKRMLSPAGSLELTMETQQQKRVKEENVPDKKGHCEILKTQDEGRTVNIDTVVSLAKGRLEQLPSSQVIHDDSSAKDRGKSPTPPLAGSSHTKSPEEYKEQLYACKITVKAEHPEELVEPFSSYTRVPVNLCVSGGLEVTETKKVQTFPTLHTSTNVSWCYLNYVKPNHAQQTDRRASVYGSWCISLYNPNLPGITTRAALSLLKSKQKTSTEIYTTADTTHSDTELLVPSRVRKPKMTEAQLPPCVQKETSNVEKEEDKRGKPEDIGPTVRRSEPARIRIFEGGYKSNEEYVYVRGRGRGKYVCEECGIRCKKPSMLKKHIRTHTDLRPYVCKHCNFAFKTKGNLTKHMKSKAHSKKCQELGLLPPSLAELDAEEGTSDERWQDSDVVEEHQFSDFEDSDDDDDDDDEDSDEEDDEEEDEEESQEEKQPDPSPTVRGTPNEPTQDPETAGSSPSYQFSPNLFPTVEPPEKDTLARSFDLPASRDTLSSRRWSPGKEASGCSWPGPSRRHLLQKRETSPKCFSTTGCPSPRRGMSPCQRLASTKEVSPLQCISPRHLSPHRDLSPRTYMSPERGASPPVRHISPSRELTGLQCSALRPGLASPPRYASPGRDEQQLSRSETQTHIKVQQGFFSSMALPHRTSETACNKQKLGPSNFPVMSRPLYSQLTPHYPPRSSENWFTHLPLHSQHLQRTPYTMIPIGGIQMVQARPSPHPALLGHSFFEPQPADLEAVPFEQQHQEESDEQIRTSRKEKEKDRATHLISTAPPISPSSTYCQSDSTPPQPDMSLFDTDPCHGEHVGEG
ncbi:transcription factor HIVEP3 [Xenopus laevis]|uniref:Transcription factor HIVEP3 n=1 Tax=Xenopus laevis TaxID=8355 RepID=A0A8J0UKH2_XENLA|nr:transcription factor HIVEP3 [Xenopus laevis]XP_041439862.1 transcription factor HIVEP3 [Xenopus laevis]